MYTLGMIGLLQRVSSASVTVNDETIGTVGTGLLVLAGVGFLFAIDAARGVVDFITGLADPLHFGLAVASGVILAFLVGIVIIGGIRRIGTVAGFIVPIMCGIYLVAKPTIRAMKSSAIPEHPCLPPSCHVSMLWRAQRLYPDRGEKRDRR
mgnify:CR=1 FL=1